MTDYKIGTVWRMADGRNFIIVGISKNDKIIGFPIPSTELTGLYHLSADGKFGCGSWGAGYDLVEQVGEVVYK